MAVEIVEEATKKHRTRIRKMVTDVDKEIQETRDQISTLERRLKHLNSEKEKQLQELEWLKKGTIVKVDQGYCVVDYMIIDQVEAEKHNITLTGTCISEMTTMMVHELRISSRETITVMDIEKVEEIDSSVWNKMCQSVMYHAQYMKEFNNTQETK